MRIVDKLKKAFALKLSLHGLHLSDSLLFCFQERSCRLAKGPAPKPVRTDLETSSLSQVLEDILPEQVSAMQDSKV